jgi:small ligand-binding sensory domain FIST
MLQGSSELSSSAALLFACNGRRAGLFGAPDHDARTVCEVLGTLPLAGLFCNGEIGPVGGATFVHGYTASLGLIEEV